MPFLYRSCSYPSSLPHCLMLWFCSSETLYRFMPRVEIVQKHNTAARRLYIRGHNGKIYPYLVMNDACLTESRREERVLQLLRLLNPCLEKRKETTKRHLFFTGMTKMRHGRILGIERGWFCLEICWLWNCGSILMFKIVFWLVTNPNNFFC